MTTFYHVSIACPVCGEVQVIEVRNQDQAVSCECGIGGIVNFRGDAESRKMVLVWGFNDDARPVPMPSQKEKEADA